MHRPALRVPRVGFALVFLPVFLGSASGAPAVGVVVPAGKPALKHSAVSAQFPAEQPPFFPATIPCVSGSCRVLVYAPAPVAPRKPLPRTTSAPHALAQR